MTPISLIHELTLSALEAVAKALLRAVGGPEHLPQSNLDFVWF